MSFEVAKVNNSWQIVPSGLLNDVNFAGFRTKGGGNGGKREGIETRITTNKPRIFHE